MTTVDKAQADHDAIQGLVARWVRVELTLVLGMPRESSWTDIIAAVKRLMGG